VVQRFGQLIAPKSGVDEVVVQAQHLTRQGFRQILLVADEHPKFVSGSLGT
jgi:hypothetical protein